MNKIKQYLRGRFLCFLVSVLLDKDDIEWIVNNIGELGVKIGPRMFFLYKGGSLEYSGDRDEEDAVYMYREVFKREFGEVCKSPRYRSDSDFVSDTCEMRSWDFTHPGMPFRIKITNPWKEI